MVLHINMPLQASFLQACFQKDQYKHSPISSQNWFQVASHLHPKTAISLQQLLVSAKSMPFVTKFHKFIFLMVNLQFLNPWELQCEIIFLNS